MHAICRVLFLHSLQVETHLPIELLSGRIERTRWPITIENPLFLLFTEGTIVKARSHATAHVIWLTLHFFVLSRGHYFALLVTTSAIIRAKQEGFIKPLVAYAVVTFSVLISLALPHVVSFISLEHPPQHLALCQFVIFVLSKRLFQVVILRDGGG